MYSSVWNCVISVNTAGFARWKVGISTLEKRRRGTQKRDRGLRTHVDLEELVDAVVHYQTVGQPDSVRLHRVPRNIGIVPNIRVVEVGDTLLLIARDLVHRPRTLDASIVQAHGGVASCCGGR